MYLHIQNLIIKTQIPQHLQKKYIFNEAHYKTLTQRQTDRQTGSEKTMVRQKRGGKMINAWHIAARK
jgi:hypothetical protein